MQPNFGSAVAQLVFAPKQPAACRDRGIHDAGGDPAVSRRYHSRLQNLTVTADDSTLTIDIGYIVPQNRPDRQPHVDTRFVIVPFASVPVARERQRRADAIAKRRNGIDFVDVGEDRRTLLVYFFLAAPSETDTGTTALPGERRSATCASSKSAMRRATIPGGATA